MSKKDHPEPDPSLIRFQFNIPKSWGFVLLGVLLGNIDEAGPLIDMLGRLIQ